MISANKSYAENIAREENAAYSIMVDEFFATGKLSSKRLLLFNDCDVGSIFVLSAIRMHEEIRSLKWDGHMIVNHIRLSGMNDLFEMLSRSEKKHVIFTLGAIKCIECALDDCSSVNQFMLELVAERNALQGKAPMTKRLVPATGEMEDV